MFNHAVVKRERERQGWSLADLVFQLHDAGLDTSDAVVLAWENGEHDPRAEALPVLARVLGVEIADLFDAREERDGRR